MGLRYGGGAVDVVGCYKGAPFVSHLSEPLVASAHLDGYIAIDDEVAAAQPAVLHPVPSRKQLVAEKCLAHGAHFGGAVRDGVEQVGVVEQDFIGLLEVAHGVEAVEQAGDKGGLLQAAQVFERGGALNADVSRQLGDVDLVGHHLRQHLEQGLDAARVARLHVAKLGELAVDYVVHHRLDAALVGRWALEVEGVVAVAQVTAEMLERIA